MSQLEQAKPIELVLPPSIGPVPEASVAAGHWSSTTWIVLIAVAILTGNAALVWWRIHRKDPLQRAFDRAAGKLGLTGQERKRVVHAAPPGCPPVSLLISESILNASVSGDEDPLIVSVRAKLERARGFNP